MPRLISPQEQRGHRLRSSDDGSQRERRLERDQQMDVISVSDSDLVDAKVRSRLGLAESRNHVILDSEESGLTVLRREDEVIAQSHLGVCDALVVRNASVLVYHRLHRTLTDRR